MVEEQLAKLRAEVAELVPVVESALAERQALLDSPGTSELIGVIGRCPLDATFYDALWRRGADLQPWGFDAATLAFELRPGTAPHHGNVTRRRGASDPEARAIAEEVLARHLRSDDARSPDLPRRDDDLRRAAVVLMAREAGLTLSLESLFEGVRAALRVLERQPRSAPAWLAVGYLRLELGDFGGAVVALERAAALPGAFEPTLPQHKLWPRFYTALAQGALGDPVAARVSLRDAVSAGFRFHERLDDPRLAGVADLEALEFDARTNDRR